MNKIGILYKLIRTVINLTVIWIFKRIFQLKEKQSIIYKEENV